MAVIYERETRDRPLSDFASEDEAYDYARENYTCVYDDDTMSCVYCRRANH